MQDRKTHWSKPSFTLTVPSLCFNNVLYYFMGFILKKNLIFTLSSCSFSGCLMGGHGETLERPLICTFNKRAQYRYSYYHYNNSIIRRVGSQSDAEQLLHALITSRRDCCNPSGLSWISSEAGSGSKSRTAAFKN